MVTKFKKGYLYRSIGSISVVIEVTENEKPNSHCFTGRALLSNASTSVVEIGRISYSWLKDYGWEEIGPLEDNNIKHSLYG
jgi:hypothetical protein